MKITKRQLRRIIKEEINNSLTENSALRGEAAYNQGTKDAVATSIGEMDGPADPRNRDYMAGFEDESDEIESRQGDGPYSVRESRNRKKVTKSRLRRIVKEALNNSSKAYATTDLSAMNNRDLMRALGDNNVAFGDLTGVVLEDADLWDDYEWDVVNGIPGTDELLAINRDIRVALKDKPERQPGTNIAGY